MQLLDYDLAQQAYEERLHKAEQNRRTLVLTFQEADQAPSNGANDFVNQIKGWLWGRPHRQGADARRPHAV